MRIPKKWRGANGSLNHTVAINTDPVTSHEVVTYRVWSARKGWRYFAETRGSIEWLLKFNRKLEKEEAK